MSCLSVCVINIRNHHLPASLCQLVTGSSDSQTVPAELINLWYIKPCQELSLLHPHSLISHQHSPSHHQPLLYLCCQEQTKEWEKFKFQDLFSWSSSVEWHCPGMVNIQDILHLVTSLEVAEPRIIIIDSGNINRYSWYCPKLVI